MLHHKFVGNLSSKTIIVFLHEGLGCIEMWKNYPQKLCTFLNIKGLIYDRAGYGKSNGDLTKRQANYLHLAADELHQLLTSLQLLNHKIILYGHSDGGSIALIYASKYPQNINSIITEAAHIFVEKETIAGIKPAIKAFKTGKLDGLKKYHGSNYKNVFNAWANIWNHPSFKNWNIEKEITNIICPQLIIQGKNDQYGTLKQVENIAQHTKGQTITFIPENCGHSPYKEIEKDVFDKVISFIKKK
jgi:pimeloyl-ACP methyl ester carboxylesterase